MNLPNKIRFFGLRKQFNIAVAAIQGLAISYAKLVIAILDIENRLEALEKRADMNDLLDGLSARHDAFILDTEIVVYEEEEEADEDTEERTED
jgi:uncharacterized protein (DUF3084 family)